MDKTKKILAIDDSPTDLAVIRIILRNDYELLTSGSALDALGILGTTRVDLILLDIEMPEMSGFEFLHQIRKIPQLTHTPVRIVTSPSGEAFLAHAMSAGASGLVAKPVQPQFLKEKIAATLEDAVSGPANNQK
jgi:CheY-like chemotaxis protein